MPWLGAFLERKAECSLLNYISEAIVGNIGDAPLRS